MNAKRKAGLAALAVVVFMGCSSLATYQKLPEDQQGALFQDLQNDPAAYRIYQCPNLIVVEPKSENRSIEVTGAGCREIDPLTATFPTGVENSTTFRALVGRDDKPYAYAYWNYRRVRIGAREVDGSTMRVSYTRVEYGGR